VVQHALKYSHPAFQVRIMDEDPDSDSGWVVRPRSYVVHVDRQSYFRADFKCCLIIFNPRYEMKNKIQKEKWQSLAKPNHHFGGVICWKQLENHLSLAIYLE